MTDTACAGDSDEPMPSIIAEHRGQRGHESVLRVTRKDAAARAEQAQLGGVPTAGVRRERASSGRATRVADEVHRVHVLALDEVEDVVHVDGALGRTARPCPPPSRVPIADHCPLACMSGPSANETNCAGPGSPGGRNGRSRSAGLAITDTTTSSGRLDRRAAGIAAAHRAEEDVLVAPDHALGHARSCRRCRARSGRRRSGGRSRGRSTAVSRSSYARVGVDVDQSTNCRDTPAATADVRDRGTSESWTMRDGIGVVEQILELVLDVAVVHVDRDRSQLVAREHHFDVLDGVAQVDADVVAGRHPSLASPCASCVARASSSA